MSEPKTDILYPLICSWGNLLSAYAKAAAGKRGRTEAGQHPGRDVEGNAFCLHGEAPVAFWKNPFYRNFPASSGKTPPGYTGWKTAIP